MTHSEIELADLQAWIGETEALFAKAVGKGENKRLTSTLNGTLLVYEGDALVYQGTQPYAAVEAYNAIGKPE